MCILDQARCTNPNLKFVNYGKCPKVCPMCIESYTEIVCGSDGITYR